MSQYYTSHHNGRSSGNLQYRNGQPMKHHQPFGCNLNYCSLLPTIFPSILHSMSRTTTQCRPVRQTSGTRTIRWTWKTGGQEFESHKKKRDYYVTPPKSGRWSLRPNRSRRIFREVGWESTWPCTCRGPRRALYPLPRFLVTLHIGSKFS